MLQIGDKVIDKNWIEQVYTVKAINEHIDTAMIADEDGSIKYTSIGNLKKVDDIPKSSRDRYFEKEAEEIAEKSETKLADRKNDGKLPMHLVPADAIKAMAAVLKVGMDKYAERNWEKGAYFSVPYSSLMRHLLAFWEGEDYDKESGELHIAHILTNAAFLLRYYEEFPELDDRPKKEK